MQEEQKKLWDFVKNHEREIQELKINFKLQSEDLKRLTKSTAENHGYQMNSLSELNKKVSDLTNDFHRRQGAKEANNFTNLNFKWLVGIFLTLFGMLITALWMR